MFPPPTASEVRQAGFELVRGGYVVAAGRRVPRPLEEQVILAQGMTAGGAVAADPASEAAYLREQLTAPYMKRFPRAGMLRRGYHVDDVDEFVDRVVAALGRAGLDVTPSRTCGAAPFRPQAAAATARTPSTRRWTASSSTCCWYAGGGAPTAAAAAGHLTLSAGVWRVATRPDEDAGMGDYRETYRRSIDDPDGFWAEAAAAVDWRTPPTTVLDARQPAVLPVVPRRRAEHLRQRAGPARRRRRTATGPR